MIGWLTARCPLDLVDKVWVERRMVWMAQRIGIDRMRNAIVVLPTREFFPDPYTADEGAVRKCMDRICGYMAIDPASVTLEIVADESMPGAVGLYEMGERSHIRIARSQLDYPPGLLATLAHELAHEILLKGGHLKPEDRDHERVTDLLPAFLGLGILIANPTIHTSTVSDGNMSYFAISKQGYLSSVMFGYALALFAFVRGERRTPWDWHLRRDARLTLRAGLRFLHRHGDSLFHPDTVDLRVEAPTVSSVSDRLSSPSPTVRLAALWDVSESGLTTPEMLPVVESRLEDRDPMVQCTAIRTLGSFGATAAGVIPRLIAAIWQGPTECRVAALQTLGEIGAAPAEVVPELGATLRGQHVDLIRAAAGALSSYGPVAASAEPDLLDALERAALVDDHERMSALLAALTAVGPAVSTRVRAHLANRDPEALRNAMRALRQR